MAWSENPTNPLLSYSKGIITTKEILNRGDKEEFVGVINKKFLLCMKFPKDSLRVVAKCVQEP